MPPPTPLIILDVQDAINQPVWNHKNNPDYLSVIEKLLKVWRENKWPVIHVKHDEATPSSTYHTHGPWNAIQKPVAPKPNEPVVIKHQNCAFINTSLGAELSKLGAKSFVLVGVVIHNSMDATIRAGKALGYHIILPKDGTTAAPVTGQDGKIWNADEVFQLSLAILDTEYAEITTSREILARFF